MTYNKIQEFDGVFFLFVHNLGLGMSEFHELFLSAILARSTPSLAYTPCVWQDEVASFAFYTIYYGGFLI
jgi:hypothetical protein